MMRKDLVGRDAEFNALLRAVHEAFEGDGTAAVVAGDPGIGKTFLLGALRRRVEELGGRVLTGRGSEFEEMPLGVFVDALDAHLRTLEPDLLAELGQETLAELAAVFPALSGLGRPRVGSDTTAEHRVAGYLAIRTLLDLVAQDRPLVLVVDDLHWADRSSRELFGFLVRRPPQGRVLVIGSYRPLQVDDDLAADVARATYDGIARYVEVRPLNEAQVAELAGVEDRRTAVELHRATGGNPFYLLTLAGTNGTVGGLDDGLPPTIARTILGELDRSGGARAFAEVAAVVGDPFDLDLATWVADLEDEGAYDAIDQLAQRGIVESGDVPRHFAFRHPLVRQAIYGALRPGRRLVLHERCAAGLADRGAPAWEVAGHLEHAARPGDLNAVEVLTDAARQAAARAPANAVRWLRTARRLLPGTASTERHLELMRQLPVLLTALGDPEEALAATLEAIELARDDATRVDLILVCVSIEQGLGRYDDAHQRLVRTLDSLGGHGELALSVMVVMVFDAFFSRDHDGVRSWTAQAVAEAERLQRPVLVAAAHAGAALAHALAGATTTAEKHLESALRLMPQLTDDDHAERLDVLGGIVGAELYLDRYESCVKHAARGLAIGRATGQLWMAPTLSPSYGTALWVVGRLEESIQHCDTAVETTRAVRHPETTAWALFNLAFAQAMAGRLEDALANGRESLALAEQQSDSVIRSWAGAILAVIECESGRPAVALETLYRTCGGPELPGVPGGWRTFLFETAVRSHLALGDTEHAEESAAMAVAWADEVGLPYARSMAHRAVGACAEAAGDHARAVEEGLAAVAAADAAGARVDAARARTLAGRALAEMGDKERAVELLTEAAEVLDTCGSPRFRDEAERELGRLGRRPHRRTSPGSGVDGLASLTAREREIADLVVERLTNPEIAQRIFLSTKTVESHLRNIFRKLDVSSRTELARKVQSAS
ncbi:hypothetical protein GCM10023339_46460 [Alloalcanivorax gelatiniphagus]